MSAAITFGSLGDILAVCQIAWSLGKALSGSRGSAKEYQDLKKDLDCFAQVLMQVLNCAFSPMCLVDTDEPARLSRYGKIVSQLPKW